VSERDDQTLLPSQLSLTTPRSDNELVQSGSCGSARQLQHQGSARQLLSETSNRSGSIRATAGSLVHATV